ncbi:MAG: hypothetical protein ACKV2T_25245 [Kofleriaceae bacterium]
MLKWLLVGIVMVAFVRPADACGEWSMTDEEKKYSVSYLINSGRISDGKRNRGSLYLDENPNGLRTVKDRKVIFDVKKDKLTKRGKPIASINADGSVAFGKRVYTIELTNPHKEHDFAAWDLTVKRGDKVILTSTEASALCAPMHRDPPATTAQMQDEIRRRVMFYLAWRETGP